MLVIYRSEELVKQQTSLQELEAKIYSKHMSSLSVFGKGRQDGSTKTYFFFVLLSQINFEIKMFKANCSNLYLVSKDIVCN